MTPAEVLLRPLGELPDPLPVPVVRGPFDAAVRPPGSKSLTNRALLLAALAEGRSTLRRPLLEADDAERMIGALMILGAEFERRGEDLEVRGVGGRWRPRVGEVRLDLGNAGTATRFLSAAALLSPVPVVIDGNARMRQRPIGGLGEALASLGAGVEYLGRPGSPPLRITPGRAGPGPRRVGFEALPSGQFVSAVMLSAPWLGGVEVELPADVTSRSYVGMTAALLRRLGAGVTAGERTIRVESGGVGPFEYAVEPDASGATYFWGAAAMAPGARVRVEGVGESSLQGDARFPGVLEAMGAVVEAGADWTEVRGPSSLRPVEADLSDMPDTAMTLAVVAAFAEGPTVMRGLRTLRVKETDRIEAMRVEWAKVGVGVEVGWGGDGGAVRLTPAAGGVDRRTGPVEFETYDDHRMAMSLALVGLRRPGVRVRNPACVGKTYPGFWRDLAMIVRSRALRRRS